MPRGRRRDDKQMFMYLIILGVIVIAFGAIVNQSVNPPELFTSENDDIRPLSASLTGGGIFGTVSSSTCYSERFVFSGNSGMGLYGSFTVGGNSLVHFFVTDEQGWNEFLTQKTTDRKIIDIPDTTGEDFWRVEIPSSGIWYVVYSRTWYTDMQKDVVGSTCRDLTGPKIFVYMPFSTSLSGTVPLNITVTEPTFSIDRVEVFLDNPLLQPSYDYDMGRRFSVLIPWDTTNHNEGTHILTVRASDNVGNIQNYTRLVKIYNIVDLTIPILVVTGGLTILFLIGLYYFKEIHFMPMMIGFVVLVSTIVGALYLTLNTIYDINEILGLVAGIIGVAGAPSAIAVAVEKVTKN